MDKRIFLPTRGDMLAMGVPQYAAEVWSTAIATLKANADKMALAIKVNLPDKAYLAEAYEKDIKEMTS